MAKLQIEQITVAADADLSSPVDLRNRILRTVIFPDNWSGTANVGYAVAPVSTSDYFPVDSFGHSSGSDTAFIVDREDKARGLGWTKMIVGGTQAEDLTITLLTELRS